MSEAKTPSRNVNGIEYPHPPPLKISGEHLEDEYPPLDVPDGTLLVNKFTGTVIAATPELKKRSDVLEVYQQPTEAEALGLDIPDI